MTDAVIVSTARTALAKSWRGAFNMTHPVTFTGHVLRHAMQRARLDPKEVEDVIVGGTFMEGAAGLNVARQVALRAGWASLRSHRLAPRGSCADRRQARSRRKTTFKSSPGIPPMN
jgi:acetyl-CoA acetyltransferase